LVARLKIGAESRFNPIPAKALRKYISYARRYVHPRMSESAANVLQKFYLRIRAQHATRDSTPITNRQLESLIRLAEARARLELRDLVSQVRFDFLQIVFFCFQKSLSTMRRRLSN
jgi:DNA helicase MCM8